jgi:hypothetical protein
LPLSLDKREFTGKKSKFMGIVSKFSLPLFSNFYLLPNQGHYTINMTSHEQKSPTTTTLILPAHSFLPSSWCIPVIYLAIA